MTRVTPMRPSSASWTPSPRSCCSTSTSPAEAGGRWSKPSAPERPEVRFLALSVSDAAEDVIGLIRAGARGYVTKTITRDELVDAIVRCAAATPCSRLAWRASSSMRSRATCRLPSTLSSISSRPRAGGPAADRPRLHLQGGGRPLAPLGQDHRDPRVGRPAQAPAVEPTRADDVGRRSPAPLTPSRPPTTRVNRSTVRDVSPISYVALLSQTVERGGEPDARAQDHQEADRPRCRHPLP